MRKVLTRKEADDMTRSVGLDAYDGNLVFVKSHGLYRWKPNAADTCIEDVNQIYYLWVYQYDEVLHGDGGFSLKTPVWLTTGFVPRGGIILYENPYESDIIIDSSFEKEAVFLNMSKVTSRWLAKVGFSPIEIISILGT